MSERPRAVLQFPKTRTDQLAEALPSDVPGAPTYQQAGTALLALYGATQATLTVPMPPEANRRAHDLLDTVRRYFDAHVDHVPDRVR